MSFLLKSTLVLLSLSVSLVIAAKETAALKTGCYQTLNAISSKDAVLNKLTKKVQFINADNLTFSLEQRMKALKVNAVSVAAIKANSIDWSTAQGRNKEGSSKQVDCNTLFQAASIAKPVAMMSVLRMAENNKVNLDTDIQQYLTSYTLPQGKQTAEHPVTFKNLLNHTSGITPGGYLGYSQGLSLPTDIEVAQGIKPVNSPAIEVLSVPGQQLRYSGGAYTLVEIALQDIFQQPFEDIMHEWVLTPTGMKSSSFAQQLLKLTKKDIAQGHNSNGETVKGGWHNHPEQAAAGLWSNANDLANFLIEIGKGYKGTSKVFSKSVINELLAEKIDDHYYGFYAYGEGDNLTIAHYGGNLGYRSAMILNVKTGDGLIVLTNSDNGSLLAGDILRAWSLQNNVSHFKAKSVAKTQLSQTQLKEFAGKYAFTEQGWQVEVRYDASVKEIAIIFPNDDVYPLTATTKENHHFIHLDTGVEAVFSESSGQFDIKLYGQIGRKI